MQKDAPIVKEEGRVGFGVYVWAIGNKSCKLVEDLAVKKSEKGVQRTMTDSYLRVLQPSDSNSESGIVNDVLF
jgi:NADH:ubiquinone reductase (non-electrogenic)